MTKPIDVFEDLRTAETAPEQETKAVLNNLADLSAAFRKAAEKAPAKHISLLRRAVDQPQWTKEMCENTAKSMDLAASALKRGDKQLCKTLMFFAKRDFDDQARRHRKASNYLIVGKKHKELAGDFAGYSKIAGKVLDQLL